VERILITEDGRTVSEIVVGSGTLADGRILLPESEKRRRVAIMTQESVSGIAEQIASDLTAAGLRAGVRLLPDREQAKSLSVAEDVFRWLNGLGLTRHDSILGVGGGAATDLTGFVSATYLRGVGAVLVPTTLLGAVDAAIGGKTGVNVDGKNLVGVFRHAERVVIDLEVLNALPESLVREGSAEILKAGLIADTTILDRYEEHGLDAPLSDLVTRAVSVKAAAVSGDFREAGPREVLNYGHTVGHAIEVVAQIPHGHAIAIGMVSAAAVAEREVGFRGSSRQRALIRSLGLPDRAPPLDAAAVRQVMELDKKRDETGLRMVLLEDFGIPVVRTIGAASVHVALAAVGIE
jgi:3-dehydroquinate synthase